MGAAAGEWRGTGSYGPVTGVAIYVSDTPFIAPSQYTPPGACDAPVTLQPGVPYSSERCKGKRGQYVLIHRAGTNASLPLCRVDVTGPAAMTEGGCPYSSAAGDDGSGSGLPPGSWKDSCSDGTVDPATCVLTALCKLGSVEEHSTQLDLRTCGWHAGVTNNGGRLQCTGERSGTGRT